MVIDVGAQNQCLGSHIFNFQLKCRWVLLVNLPRNEEDATKCCNAGTRSARRRRVIGRVLAEELEKLMGPLEW